MELPIFWYNIPDSYLYSFRFASNPLFFKHKHKDPVAMDEEFCDA